jgi:catechol 2,3-dioxygenase-like lactoylglutathione lyase family enzyme
MISVIRLHHIGVVVADLQGSSTLLESGFGLIPEPGVTNSDLATRFFVIGDVRIELIEVRDPIARRDRLGDRKARIEHIAFEVEDLKEAIAGLASLGVRPRAEPRASTDYITFWTDPETSQGINYQFLEMQGSR